MVEKGNLYGVDAKYAGSPRDVDEHSDKEEEKEHVRPSMRMNESLQSQGNHNPFAKKLKVPSLKVMISMLKELNFIRLEGLVDIRKK